MSQQFVFDLAKSDLALRFDTSAMPKVRKMPYGVCVYVCSIYVVAFQSFPGNICSYRACCHSRYIVDLEENCHDWVCLNLLISNPLDSTIHRFTVRVLSEIYKKHRKEL
jgi:hypothetical protein